MSDLSPLADIAARLEALRSQAAPVDVGAAAAPVRFVVATDWSKAAVPLAALKAFQAAFAGAAPVELCFATPNEPGEADASCVQVLLEGLGSADGLALVSVESFAEVTSKPYDSAVVPAADAEALIHELAGLIVRMFDAARRVDDGTIPGGNAGDREALRRRLERFAA